MNFRTHHKNIAHLEEFIVGILNQRTRDPREYETDPQYRRPKYVVSMCERISAQLRGMGATHVQTEDVLAKDSLATGHSDYVQKLSLYCAEMLIPQNHERARERTN